MAAWDIVIDEKDNPCEADVGTGTQYAGGAMLLLLLAAMVSWETVGAYHAGTWVRLGSPSNGFDVPPIIAGLFALSCAGLSLFLLLGGLDQKGK